jgi:hypothetical protein
MAEAQHEVFARISLNKRLNGGGTFGLFVRFRGKLASINVWASAEACCLA